MDTLHAPGARTRLEMEPVDESGKGVGEEESGRRTASVGALMIKFHNIVRGTSTPCAPQLRISRVWGGDPGLSKCYANIRSSVFAPPNLQT